MDALIYTTMSGGERLLRAQQVHANNLANLDTPGFRGDYGVAQAFAVQGSGYDSRHMTKVVSEVTSDRPGPVRVTGRDLDVAVEGTGYFAVGMGNAEAYTRAGAMSIDNEGQLMVNGRPVLGDGGPIVLPEFTRMAIGVDGTISVLPVGGTEMQPVDRLKLVKPDGALVKNEVGFLVPIGGRTLDTDDTVRVRGGALEGSNVSAVEEMVAVMDLNRQFEIQMRLYKAADSMADAGNRLMRG